MKLPIFILRFFFFIFTRFINFSQPNSILFSTQPGGGGAIWDIYLRGPALSYRERGEGRTSFGSSGISSHW